MWSRRASISGLLALTACGFAPVYGPGGNSLALRDTIIFDTPETIAGFRLRLRLEERLGTAAAPDFALEVDLEVSRDDVAITEDGDITRFTLPGTARYTLFNEAHGVIAAGSVNAFTSYSATGTTVATQAAAEDAEARLAVILADLIVTRLLAAPLP